MTYIAIRRGPNCVVIGEAHARMRRGKPAVELRRCTYHPDIDKALEAAMGCVGTGERPETPTEAPTTLPAPSAGPSDGLRLKRQTRLVLRHLQEHGSITDLEALAEHRIRRLSARILEIREALGPHRVETVNEPHEGGTHARYVWVPPEQADLLDSGEAA